MLVLWYVDRKSVLGLYKDLLSLDHISMTLVPDLMNCLQTVLKDPVERMTEVASIISDIQVPNIMEEQPVDPDTLHRLKYKVSTK